MLDMTENASEVAQKITTAEKVITNAPCAL